VLIKDMNHVLRVCKTDAEQAKTYLDPKLALHPELVKSIVPFLTQTDSTKKASQ